VESLRLAQQASDEISGDTPYRILGGYDHVVRWLSSFEGEPKPDINLNTIVHDIEWRPGYVRVNQFVAEQAVVTLPVAVLQANIVNFNPPLPAKADADRSLSERDDTRITVITWHDQLCDQHPLWLERRIEVDDIRLQYCHRKVTTACSATN